MIYKAFEEAFSLSVLKRLCVTSPVDAAYYIKQLKDKIRKLENGLCKIDDITCKLEELLDEKEN